MENEPRSGRSVSRKRILLSLLAVVVLGGAIASFRLTRDGELVTPVGEGTVELEAGIFEQLPLPDYATEFLDEDYRSYLVEVEPGIKIHVLEVGTGYPVYLQHGAPTSGFLYRKVADLLPRDQFRIIMPTMVGLGFSSKVPASEHTLENHITWMNRALGQLELEELIYVGHDWGGPVGMGALERSPELLRGAVILNTVLAAPDADISLPTPVRIAKTPVIGEIVLEGVVSTRWWSSFPMPASPRPAPVTSSRRKAALLKQSRQRSFVCSSRPAETAQDRPSGPRHQALAADDSRTFRRPRRTLQCHGGTELRRDRTRRSTVGPGRSR